MATRHGDPDAVIVKGAPEAVLPMCADDVGDAGAEIERLTGAGERVLVFAVRDDPLATPRDHLPAVGAEGLLVHDPVSVSSRSQSTRASAAAASLAEE